MKAALLLVLLLLPPLQAAPLRLKLQQQQDSLSFHYQFDINGQRQQLSFSLSHATLAAHFPKFRALKPTLMQHYLWRDLQRHTAQYPGVTIQRLPGADSLAYRLTGKDNTLLQQLQQDLIWYNFMETKRPIIVKKWTINIRLLKHLEFQKQMM